MSSHREAPGTSKDPVADNTDVYAFRSPDNPDTVTFIANYLPFEAPFGGPNFFEFDPQVLYSIQIDNNGDGQPDVTYDFTFDVKVADPNTFLYNVGPIGSISSPNWNRKQFYSVTRTDRHGSRVLGSNLPCPPCNIGPSSTANYPALAQEAIQSLPGGRTVFAGQRLDGFYVDVGAIFDLGDLRPFENLHLASMVPPTAGVNSTNGFSVHSIALQVPLTDVTRGGTWPSDPTSSSSVIGVWASASRQHALIREHDGSTNAVGGFVQVSRLGNPLFNEVIVPMGKKDLWNSLPPSEDKQFLQYVQHPELASLIANVLYTAEFTTLAKLTAPRADLVAILLTGIPSGLIAGFQNYTGPTYADMLRLNLAIEPTASPNAFGVVGGDLAGFPNGRRVFDDVVSVELRAIAGALYPLVDPSYKPDGAASLLTDGLDPSSTSYLTAFPYLGTPQSGYNTAPLSTVA